MEPQSKIYVAGHSGMVGAALLRKLTQQGFRNLVTRGRAELDLTDQGAVADFFARERPEYVFCSAGRTGGIYANNTYRADFLYENVMMQSNVIHQSFLHEVRKLMFFSCSCIYPRECPQPMNEEHILCGPLEPTNEPFALAKIVGQKMCEAYNRQYGTDFITLIPTNLYGPGQKYEPMNSLVIPALIQKIHAAKCAVESEVVIWGSGRPSRDFLYVDDLADASIFIMQNYEGNVLLNIGTGHLISIAELAAMICKEIGYTGDIVYDRSLPDGVSQKLQDISGITSLGWQPRTSLIDGIHLTYTDFLEKYDARTMECA
jgi:GDP-L-fucose synthase